MRFPACHLLILLLAVSGANGGQPQVWFAPEDCVRRAERGEPSKGDFMELFAPDAPWRDAASHVQVFQIYPQFLSRATDAELHTVMDGLKRRHIALALSYGMLHRKKGAEMHEGYGAEVATRDIARLRRLGADLRYVVADEPLLFGHFYWGQGAEPASIADVAKDVVATAREFRAAFPEVRIGMDDPIMLYAAKEWAPAMREFLAEYRREFHEPMGFVRLECASFPAREWLPRYLAAAELFRMEGVAFGTLVTGDASDSSDAQWFAKAVERYATWESGGRGAPAQVVFQSWMMRPLKILPECAPDTFTHFVNGYFRERASLSAACDARRLRARLADATGRGLAGKPVALGILPGCDDPAMIRRTIRGTVPEGTRFVQVGLRIGLEGSRAGKAHLALGPTRYSETGSGAQSAVFDFGRGMTGWGISGDASATPAKAAGTGAGDAGLEITAEAGQRFLLNSKLAPATAGCGYRFDFDVHVRPGTETGYLAVFFFDASKKVILRVQEPLLSEAVRALQSVRTDADGRIEIPLDSDELRLAREFLLTFPGDAQFRPAFARLPQD